MTICRLRIAWMTRNTKNAHSECIILIIFSMPTVALKLLNVTLYVRSFKWLVLFVNRCNSWYVVLWMYFARTKHVIKLRILVGHNTHVLTSLSRLVCPLCVQYNIMWAHIWLTMNMRNEFSGRNFFNQKKRKLKFASNVQALFPAIMKNCRRKCH
jgi:hypothetical protein